MNSSSNGGAVSTTITEAPTEVSLFKVRAQSKIT